MKCPVCKDVTLLMSEKKGVEIDRRVVRGRRVQPGAAESVDEPVELVGNHIVGRTDTQLVDLLLYAFTGGFIFRFRQFIIFQ